jgi:hypothetical protein
MKSALIVLGTLIFVYILIRTIAFILDDSEALKKEVDCYVKLLHDLITMSETDPLAKELVEKFKLREFDLQDPNLFTDDESLAKYQSKLSQLIDSMFVCSHYMNEGTSAHTLLYRERSCRECEKQCNLCAYRTARLADYHEKYYNGLEDYDMY